jgi:oxaloacetate decarboxylase (Na+ extruding) subunit alpha
MEVRLIDTTFRDGPQSLWASGLRSGMIEAVAQAVDRAGFAAVEVPVGGIYFKKFIRDLKENPWDMARMVARTMPHAVKGCMTPGVIHPFEAPPPRAVVELYYALLADIGALNRAQSSSNTHDQITTAFPWMVPMFRKLGFRIALALSYTISPRHSDEYYAQKTRDLLPFKPDAIYLKDQGGLLTPDRARTLLPAILASAGEVGVELHSHCTTGLAPLVYLEALKLGIHTLHTALPPLANGSSQPSVFNVAANARLMGYRTGIDEKLLRAASQRLTAIAKEEHLPIGAPLEYDQSQYVHQVPGGVISNLKHQLGELRIQHRLDQVLEETVQVRRDLGYPIMITPHSQFVVTQAAINVAMGERYKVVIDELILFAQGVYGEDSGYTWMDQNLKDTLLATHRAKELEELGARQHRHIGLKELRDKLGGPGVSDEEFLLRYIMKGAQEVEAMHAAGPPKQYYHAAWPLPGLLQELSKHKRVRYIHFRRGADSVTIQSRTLA